MVLWKSFLVARSKDGSWKIALPAEKRPRPSHSFVIDRLVLNERRRRGENDDCIGRISGTTRRASHRACVAQHKCTFRDAVLLRLRHRPRPEHGRRRSVHPRGVVKPRSVTGGFIVGKLSEDSLSIVKGQLLAGRNVGDLGVGSVAIRSTTVLETGRWYHVATTFDGMSLTLYVNGRPEVSARPLTRLKAFSIEATLIGAQENQERLCNFFLGLIGEVRIWNVSRTAGQMLASMDNVDQAASGLVARYSSWSNPAGRHVNHS